RAMLEVDATELPDENPLFVDDPQDPRCADVVTGENPDSVSECMGWANTPVPEDVWPQEGSSDEGDNPEEGADSADPANPSEGGASADVPNKDETSSATTWIVTGSAVLLLLAVITGIVVAKNVRKSSN